MPSDKTSLSKILVIGPRGAGKTALVNAYIHGGYSPTNLPHNPYITHILYHKTTGATITAPELAENSSEVIKKMKYAGANAIFLLVDLNSKDKWNIDHWAKDIDLYNEENKPVFLIATRSDLCAGELSSNTEALRKAAARSGYSFEKIFVTSIVSPGNQELNQCINIESKDEDKPCNSKLGILNFVLEQLSSLPPTPKKVTYELEQTTITIGVLTKLCFEEYSKKRNYGLFWALSIITCSQWAGSHSMKNLHNFCKKNQGKLDKVSGYQIMGLITNERRRELISVGKDKQNNVPESPAKDGTEKIIRQIFSL